MYYLSMLIFIGNYSYFGIFYPLKKKKRFNNDLNLKLQSCCYTEEIIAQFIVSVGGIEI